MADREPTAASVSHVYADYVEILERITQENEQLRRCAWRVVTEFTLTGGGYEAVEELRRALEREA